MSAERGAARHALRLTKLEHKLFRSNILPIAFGFPFGLSIVVPVNMPLPTKIVTQVLQPIDIAAEFGDDPGVAEIDAHVRFVMHSAIDRLARKRGCLSSAGALAAPKPQPVQRDCRVGATPTPISPDIDEQIEARLAPFMWKTIGDTRVLIVEDLGAAPTPLVHAQVEC